jgi:hypothetical protein
MKTRHACFFALGAAWCGGSVMLACSSSSPSMMGSPDAAMDTTTERSMFDALQPDGRTTLPDGTNTDSHPGDGGIGDGGGVDTGIVGNCSPVNGPACDIVKQNCPSGHECVVVLDKDAALGATTECVTDQATEVRGAGQLCCPNDPKGNECKPGMTCVGYDCVGDASSGAVCAPACCPPEDGGAGSDNCGTNPSGFPGQCDLNLEYDGGDLYATCTYATKCIALDVAPCGKGYECIVNEAGASNCDLIIGPPDAASIGIGPEGQGCTHYSCAQDLGCIGLEGSDGGECLWQCYYATGGAPPFDAGLLDGGVGHGGCPSGYTCDGIIGYPAWLGACIPP